MLKDITLGQFFPGESLLHKADPRTKLILTVFYIVLLFTSSNFLSYAFIGIFSLYLIYLSKIPLKIILSSLKPILFVLIFTFILNMFFTGGEDLIYSLGPVKLYSEGIIKAFVMAFRILLLITTTCLFMSYTTSPIKLTDGIEQLFAPLKKIYLPVHEFAMMMTIALRFIPTLIDETDKIMNAQKTRGADFTEGGILKRAKALVPILIPLFVSAFRRADELAIAMECRCYRGGVGRTRMTKLSYTKSDLILYLLFFTVLLLVIGSKFFF